jgi:hypothetical protein
MNPTLQAQASQAAAQGQSQLANYNNQAATSKAQYGTYQAGADQAKNQVNDYTNYMAGAGSGTNLYNSELGKQMTNVGYDPNQMTAARGNLNQATGALSAYSDFANTGASKFGLNAGGFAAANAGALGGLNNNISAQQGVVNGLSDLYKTAQTGANQSAGLGVQGEQNTLGGYQKVYEDAANQRDQAASMMNFYNDLAQKQGGMNAQQQQYYGQAQQAYAGAQAAMAQAGLYAAQAGLANQQLNNTAQDRAALAAKTSAAAGESYNKANGMSWNGQLDPTNGAQIMTAKF